MLNKFKSKTFFLYLILLAIHISGLLSYTITSVYLFYNVRAFEYLLPGDLNIPFVPIFIYPYYFWYLYMAIPIIYGGLEALVIHYGNSTYLSSSDLSQKLPDSQNFSHSFRLLFSKFSDFCKKRYTDDFLFYIHLFSASIPLLIMNISFFILLPSYCPRPILATPDTFDTFTFALYQFIWKLDRPVNAMPSMHVSLTILFSLVLVNYFPEAKHLKVFAIIVSIFIALSTLFTYQHHYIDVLTGILLAYLAFIMSKYIKDFLCKKNKKK